MHYKQTLQLCVVFELSNSLVSSCREIFNINNHKNGIKLLSKHSYQQISNESNLNYFIQRVNSQSTQKQTPKNISETIMQQFHIKQLKQNYLYLGRELNQLLQSLKKNNIQIVLFAQNLLSNFMQQDSFQKIFTKIIYKRQTISKELFTCLNNLNIKKQNCIFIGDNMTTTQMIKNLDISIYEIRIFNDRQRQSQTVNTIRKIPSYIQNFKNKLVFLQGYKSLYPKPNLTDLQKIEIDNLVSITQQFKRNQTFYSFNKILNLFKRFFPFVRYRQIQRVAFREFLNLQEKICLLQKLKQNFNKNTSYKQFDSLAGKKIRHQSQSSFIEIRFSTFQDYRKYLKNFEICKKYFNVPQIVQFNNQQLKISQKFIHNISHTMGQEQCIEFVDLLKKVNTIDKEITQLPVEKFVNFVEQMKQNINTFNMFVPIYKINIQESEVLIKKLKQLANQIDKCQYTFLYRDINLTNILRQIQTNKLFLVDFDNICYGPYILDLCFVLNDKYYYFDDLTVYLGIRHYVQLFSLKQQEVEKDFAYCSYFMCVRWLINLTNCYIKNYISFHMNLKTLLVQLLRSFYRISKFLTTEQVQQHKLITRKLIKGFLSGYSQVHKLQNLDSLPLKVFLIYGAPCSQKSQILKVLLIDNPIIQPQLINVNERLIKLRKKCIDKYFNISSIELDYKFIFKKDYIKEFNQEIQRNLVNKILTQNPQDIDKFKKWYQQTINQKSCIICEIFLAILQKSDKVIIVQTDLRELWEEIGVLLSGSTVLLNSLQNQQNVLRQMGERNQLVIDYNYMNIQSQKYCAVILAAGQGSRYGYIHKALLQINGKSLLEIWVQKLLTMNITQIVIVDLKQRVHKTSQVIKNKFSKCLNFINVISQQKALGPGDTLMEGLKQVNKQKVLTISCDTFSNLPISQLYYDQSKVDGKILINQSIKQGKYTLKQYNILKLIQDRSLQKAVCYGGIGCFSRSKIFSFYNQKIQQIKNFGDILTKYVKNFKLQGMKLGQNHFMYNINTEDDHKQAFKIAKEVNDND